MGAFDIDTADIPLSVPDDIRTIRLKARIVLSLQVVIMLW